MEITKKEAEYFENVRCLNDRVIVKITPLSATLTVIGSKKGNYGVVVTDGKNVKKGDVVHWSPVALYEGVIFKDLKNEGCDGEYASLSENSILLVDNNG